MKKFSIYGLFHGRQDNDLPDLKEENTAPTLGRFFKLLRRKFWKLISLNLLMLPMIIPIAVAVFVYLGISKTPSGGTAVFPQLYGANLIEQTPESTFWLDLFGGQYMIPSYGNVGTYVAIGACILFLVITFGWQNIGATYILRSIVRGDPVFLFSDYFYAVKRNLLQGFFLGLLDFLILFLLAFDFMYFQGLTGSFFADFMFYAFIALFILYFFMRFYIYHLQITFELSIRKILKNALIFTTLGVKRNLMAFLGIVILTALAIGLMAIFVVGFGFNMIAIPLILPLFYYLSFTAFMASYAAYPIIDRYMIAPFQKDNHAEDRIEEEPPETNAEEG